LAKESNLQSKAQCVTIETNTNDMNTNELMNGKEMIYKPFWEADVEEKRTCDIWDDGDRDDTKWKALSLEEKPKKILKRERPVRDLTKPVVEKTKPQYEKMWNQLRESIDIGELSKRTLDAPVPGVTVRELLSISPDLIQQWFGVKHVPPIKNKEPDAQVNSIKKEMMRKLYACTSPKCKGRIEEDEFEMLIDSGAELCLMSRNVFEELELPIDLTVDWSVGSANSQKTKAYGICHDVPVTVGGITARCQFFVLENLSQDIILGRPWERMVRAKHDNRDDGSCFITIYDERGNVATFCSVPAHHKRNRAEAKTQPQRSDNSQQKRHRNYYASDGGEVICEGYSVEEIQVDDEGDVFRVRYEILGGLNRITVVDDDEYIVVGYVCVNTACILT